MTDDRAKNNQLAKANPSSLQKKVSNIVSRGLSDLALLDVEKSKAVVEKSLLQKAKEWFKKGYDFYENKEYDAAIKAYTNAIALNPNYADAYFYRGLAYDGKRQYGRAIEDYNNAIKIEPALAIGVYYNCGMIYFYEICDMDKAIENFDKLIELEPNDAEAYLYRGFTYNHKGDVNRAIADFKKACDLGAKAGCENLQRILQTSELYNKEGQYRVNKESIEPSQNRETTDSYDQKKYYYDNFAISSLFLIIEDVCHGKIGCVVTGKVSKGKLSVGDYVTILGLKEKPRNAIIKGIEMNKELRKSAKKSDIIGILFESEQNLLTVKKGDFVVKM